VWDGQRGVAMGLADGYGTVDSVARDVIKASDIVDYTVRDNLADRLAKRFGVGVMSALGISAQQTGLTLR
jgi:protease-4